MKALAYYFFIAAAIAATDAPLTDWAAAKGGELISDASGHVVAAEFRASWITDSDLERLAAMPDLQRIDLSHTRITDVGFEHLKKLEHVQSVNLYFAEQIGDGAAAAMKNWKHLRELNMRGTRITDAGLAHFANHASLESLDIGYALITDGGFDALTALPNLKSLAVGGNKISDVGLNLLRQIPTLTAIDVSGAQRTDSGLWSASMTDISLDVIGSLTRLEHLNVRGTKISDAGMDKLARLTNLQSLDAAETQLSAKGLAVIEKFRKLRELNLYNAARVNDEILPLLAKLPSLEWVELAGTKVTPATRPTHAKLPL